MRLLPLTLFLTILITPTLAIASLETHAHLFMKHGITWLHKGEFFSEKILATNWDDRFLSQANPKLVNESGIKVMVIALYAHPHFTVNLKESIRRQVKDTEKFVQENPEWAIARSAAEAKQHLKNKKRVIVFSLEGASEIIESEKDIEEFVDRLGIRIITYMHFVDDELGGAAYIGGWRNLGNPIGLIKNLFDGLTVSEGARINRRGLTDKGIRILDSLIDRGVWIDLSHSSDATQKDIIARTSKAGQPMLYTHTMLRRYRKTERALADWQINEIKRHGGFVGLIPSEEYLKKTRVDEEHCPDSCAQNCQKGVFRLAQQFDDLAEEIGAENISVGSDINAPLPHLENLCQKHTDFDKNGFFHIGQTKTLWQAMRKVSKKVPPAEKTIQRFLELWGKARTKKSPPRASN